VGQPIKARAKKAYSKRRPSSRMNGPGVARRQLLLNSARKMLRTTRLADLSLGALKLIDRANDAVLGRIV
jgi:hypothetical protein